LNQITELFERDKSVISKHIKNIFADGELDSRSTVAKYATVQTEGNKRVTRQIEHYNLDAIISVGYRVNSKRGTLFRQWANSVLKSYMLDGYALNQKSLITKGFSDLEKSISLLSRAISQQEQISHVSQAAIRIIQEYARSWSLLLQYDEKQLKLPTTIHSDRKSLSYEICLSCISDLKKQLMTKKEASDIFGIERARGLESILGNIDQTFASQPLYPSAEEVAAHLLYFVIKDHPFTDGNKRIGSFLFLLYLSLNELKSDTMNEVTLVALALLVAESKPAEKEFIIPLIVNLLGPTSR
jgi:death-on-curing family protein